MSMYDEILSNNQIGLQTPLFIGEVCGYGKDKKAGTLQVKHLLMEENNNLISDVYLCSFYGGKEYGMYVIPEIGDLVVVSFLGENGSFPVILGTLWMNNSNYFTECFKKQGKIKQLVTKGKNTILLEEEDKKQKITIMTPKKQKIVIDDEKEKISITDQQEKQGIVVDIKNKKIKIVSDTIEMQCGQSTMELKKDGSITTKGKTLKIEGTSITMKGQQIKIEGNQMQINAKASLDIKGGSKCDISASGILQVKGAMVKVG